MVDLSDMVISNYVNLWHMSTAQIVVCIWSSVIGLEIIGLVSKQRGVDGGAPDYRIVGGHQIIIVDGGTPDYHIDGATPDYHCHPFHS